jgi:hypothetical protein
MLSGQAGQDDAGADAQLLEGMAKVAVDSMRRNIEPFGYFAVGQPVGDQPDYGEFRLGQGRPPRRGSALGRQAALDPEPLEALADPGQVPPGPGLDQVASAR